MGKRRSDTIPAIPINPAGFPFVGIEGEPGPAGPAGPPTTDASLLTSGTLPAARLPSPIPGLIIGTHVQAQSPVLNAVSAAQAQNTVLAGPTSGSGLAAFRALVAADLPVGVPVAEADIVNAGLLARNADAETITGVWDFANGLKERGRTVKAGEWTDIDFAAGNYIAQTGAWTVVAGNQVTYAYTIVMGLTALVAFAINATSVTAAPTYLALALPGALVPTRQMDNTCMAINAGVVAPSAMVRVFAGASFLFFYTDLAATPWTATAGGNTFVQGQLAFQINP